MKSCKECNSTDNKKHKWYAGPTCRACYYKTYHTKNRDKHLNEMKEYRENNKEKCKELKDAWYEENKEKAALKKREWLDNNLEYVAEHKKEYNKTNRDKIYKAHRQYVSMKMETDVNFKLAVNLRSRFSSAIKNNHKSGSAVDDLGCSIDEFKNYLESKFVDDMSWSNYNHKTWHIDHIRPLSSFDLTNRDELLKACHYTNMQPLWAKDNLSKGKRLEFSFD